VKIIYAADVCYRPTGSIMKSHALILPAFLTAILLSAGLDARAINIISTFPAGGGDGFYAGTDSPGNYWGGAVAFTPQQNYTLTSATVGLSGYDGSYGQLASLGIFSDISEPYNTSMPDQPGGLLASGTVAPNDGSQANFTVDFSGGMTLLANTTYWLFVQDASPNGWQFINGFNWVGGGSPTGDAVYNGSELFAASGFVPSSATPAFSIDETFASVPDAGPNGFVSGAAILGVLIVSRWGWFKPQSARIL
jgi:hypothetical protein